ncbi:MAG: RagB/SusD family nutrient uptake outer membrane protein [Candidatus Symbiothrix sp.]|jgi:hypothetical protein|nr:RagB/SusD family nutrient uptake outer membrane protein [Candidatus Symbiothrix sp.]
MKTNILKNSIQLITVIGLVFMGACSDYLNVVPDDIPTMDHAFSNRTTSEKFLFTCYSYLPNPAAAFNTSGPAQSRECWISPSQASNWYWVADDNSGANLYTWRIAKGEQNSNDPLLNNWDGKNGGTALFVAIRDCNIFLENIDKATGILSSEKERWVAEVKFLKAYYHFLLLRQYGPIPIIRENLPIAATPEVLRVYREPVDEVANYIVTLLDEAAAVLSPVVDFEEEELGRATKSIVLALKAQVLTLMASPLFNGNPYMLNYADKRGTLLFPQQADPHKWEIAATAIKAAIDCAEQESNRRLFNFSSESTYSPAIMQEMSLRGAVTERWNREIIWGSVRDDGHLQALANVRVEGGSTLIVGFSSLAPTLDQAELFYTNNGLPITEDKEYIQSYPNIYDTSVATEEDDNYVRSGFETANLNFKREPRYYSSFTFDGGYFFGNSNLRKEVNMKLGTLGGGISERFSVTGYLPKKLVNRETVHTSSWTVHWYSYPFIRLADLYLMYAEALNEVKATPDNEVYEYIDKVRERAGLQGVRDTWTSTISLHPEYITNKNRMRDIIHRERLIELSFENAPYWDILRWMEAETRWNNQRIRGWNIVGENTEEYYQVKTVAISNFSYRDYFSPISLSALERDPNLVQNPGW